MSAGIRWAFVLAGGLWVGLALVKGLRARPGRKLQGPLRTAFRPVHWALYALLAATVALTLASLIGLAPTLWAWNALLVLLVAGTFHAILHLWRHTTLMDGALRTITPRAFHKHL